MGGSVCAGHRCRTGFLLTGHSLPLHCTTCHASSEELRHAKAGAALGIMQEGRTVAVPFRPPLAAPLFLAVAALLLSQCLLPWPRPSMSSPLRIFLPLIATHYLPYHPTLSCSPARLNPHHSPLPFLPPSCCLPFHPTLPCSPALLRPANLNLHHPSPPLCLGMHCMLSCPSSPPAPCPPTLSLLAVQHT